MIQHLLDQLKILIEVHESRVANGDPDVLTYHEESLCLLIQTLALASIADHLEILATDPPNSGARPREN